MTFIELLKILQNPETCISLAREHAHICNLMSIQAMRTGKKVEIDDEMIEELYLEYGKPYEKKKKEK